LNRHRLLYWLCVGEPVPPEGVDLHAQAEQVELPPYDTWLPLRPLVPRSSEAAWVRQALQQVSVGQLLPELKDELQGYAVLSGVYQVNDFLDEAHRCAQKADNRDGAYWHAIMHRREPDYSNSRYWYRRVGDHPLFGPLGEAADRLLRSRSVRLPTAVLDARGRWDPFGFVSLCARLEREEAIRPDSELVAVARELQALEMKLLLAWTVEQAV